MGFCEDGVIWGNAEEHLVQHSNKQSCEEKEVSNIIPGLSPPSC